MGFIEVDRLEEDHGFFAGTEALPHESSLSHLSIFNPV